jgi:hypothetical protein
MTKLPAVAVLSLSLFAAPIFAANPLQVKTLFRTGIYSDGGGQPNIVLADVTGDNIRDVVSCSAGSAFVLAKSGSEMAPAWFSEPRGCTAVAAGDADGDGHVDVIAGGSTISATLVGTIAVYDPRSLGAARAEVQLPVQDSPLDIAFGDVDHNGSPEIAVVSNRYLYVYDARTLALEWMTDKGGRHVFIADLEGDGVNEIVVSSGHILNGITRSEKWGWVGGFGSACAVGDVDGDGRAEIAYQSASSTATIIDGETMTSRSVNLGQSADSLGIGSPLNDGVPELLVGNNQWGSVSGIRVSDSAVLWQINNPEHGVPAIAAGDVTGDGSPDVVWGAGITSSGADVFFVGNPVTRTITWRSPDLDGTFGAAVADLDGDGKLELVTKTTTSESGYSGGAVQIFDLQTRARKTMLPRTGPAAYLNISHVAVGQLDADPALEIAILGSPSYYSGSLLVFDGITGAAEYTSPASGFGEVYLWPQALAVANIDADPIDEIIVSTSDSHVEALNGASNVIQWTSPLLDGQIRDLAVADVNNDGVKEIVVGTTSTMYVLNASTGAQLTSSPISSGLVRVAATTGRFALLGGGGLVSLYSAALTPVWSCTGNPSQVFNALAFTAVGGQARLAVADPAGRLLLYPLDGTSCPVPDVQPLSNEGAWELASVDVNGDSRPELVVSRNTSVEIDSLAWMRCDGAACPTIAASYPTTSPNGMTLSGTISGPAPIASVRYETTGATGRAGAGSFLGTSWSAGPMQFARGTTTVSVTVIDTSDNAVVLSYSLATGGYLPSLPPPSPSRPRAVHH